MAVSTSTAVPRVEPYLRVQTATTPAWLSERRLAFLSDASGVPQVWAVALEGGAPEALTTFGERIGSLLANRAGGGLIFGMDAGGNERQQIWVLHPGAAPVALTAAPAVIHTFGAVSPDGRSFAYAANGRDERFFDVWSLDLSDPDASHRLLLARDETLTPLDWSPDGGSLLIRRSNTNLDDDLLLLSLAGDEPEVLTPHTGEAGVASARFAADGRAIYLITNQNREFSALVRLDLVTRTQTPLVELAWDVEALALDPTGAWLAYAVNEAARSRLVLREIATGQEREVSGLPTGVVEGLTWSPAGDQLAFSLSGPCDPADIWVCGRDGGARRVTAGDLAGLDREQFVAPETIAYPTFDGRTVPALWYRPRHADGAVPVVVDVHGGPEGQRRVTFSPVTQFLLARGYAVLAPNVRGSTGYGKTYCHLDDVERRMDAVADLAAAVDWLRTQPEVAPDRIAVYGGSYGGFMVLASLTTYPERWAAGVDIVGIANFLTFFERTGPWRRRLRAAEYGDPERDRDFLESISPIHRAEAITAPLLVIHGRNDPRVPLVEAEQIAARLRTLDRDVALIVYDDEGHGLVKLPNRIDGYGAMADFLDRVLGRAS